MYDDIVQLMSRHSCHDLLSPHMKCRVEYYISCITYADFINRKQNCEADLLLADMMKCWHETLLTSTQRLWDTLMCGSQHAVDSKYICNENSQWTIVSHCYCLVNEELEVSTASQSYFKHANRTVLPSSRHAIACKSNILPCYRTQKLKSTQHVIHTNG